jgi:Carboxypeptidase regulatory-like domain
VTITWIRISVIKQSASCPNLTLSRKTIISGQIRDESLAPLAHSKVVLRRYISSSVQTPVATTETDETGHFSLDAVPPGEYRLLASPARWAAQPEKLDCPSTEACRLDVVLKFNPTDQAISQCPIR